MSSGRLQEVKNNGKSLTIRPKRWSQSPTEGVPFTRGSNRKALTEKIWCFGLAVIYGRWLLMRGGCT